MNGCRCPHTRCRRRGTAISEQPALQQTKSGCTAEGLKMTSLLVSTSNRHQCSWAPRDSHATVTAAARTLRRGGVSISIRTWFEANHELRDGTMVGTLKTTLTGYFIPQRRSRTCTRTHAQNPFGNVLHAHAAAVPLDGFSVKFASASPTYLFGSAGSCQLICKEQA